MREREIPKGTAEVVGELLQSLLVLRDARDGLRAGGRHHALALAGQLRALLLERRRDSRALLLSLTDDLGMAPQVHVMGNVELPNGLPEPIVQMAGLPITLERELPGQKAVPLREIADLPLLKSGDGTYSVADLIKYLANRSGGAHYSKAVPEGLARILALDIPFLPMRDVVLNGLLQIGQAVYQVGLDVVRSLTDLDLFADLGISETRGGMHLVDGLYPGGLMRLTILLSDDRRLAVQAMGLGGVQLQARIGALVDWSVPHVIHVQLRHDDEVNAHLRLAVDDGTIAAEATLPQPVFCSNSWHEYDVALNRPADGHSGESAMALSGLAVLQRSSPMSVAKALVEFGRRASDPERDVVHYQPGSSGFAGFGERDISNSGDVVKSRMSLAMASGEEASLT